MNIKKIGIWVSIPIALILIGILAGYFLAKSDMKEWNDAAWAHGYMAGYQAVVVTDTHPECQGICISSVNLSAMNITVTYYDEIKGIPLKYKRTADGEDIICPNCSR
jgi:hypothetical protein